MYFLFKENDCGNKDLWQFHGLEELLNFIRNDSSDNEELLLSELGEMVIVKGQEYKISLKELQYIKEFELIKLKE